MEVETRLHDKCHAAHDRNTVSLNHAPRSEQGTSPDVLLSVSDIAKWTRAESNIADANVLQIVSIEDDILRSARREEIVHCGVVGISNLEWDHKLIDRIVEWSSYVGGNK